MDKTRCNDVLKVEADRAVARRFSLQGKTIGIEQYLSYRIQFRDFKFYRNVIISKII